LIISGSVAQADTAARKLEARIKVRMADRAYQQG
jgi:hypothetical protein